MNKKLMRGFASNPQLASEVAKETKSKQSPEERRERARAAARGRWEKEKHHDNEQSR